MTAGYSGKAAYEKLGILPTTRLSLTNAPEKYAELIGCPFRPAMEERDFDVAHGFFLKSDDLESWLRRQWEQMPVNSALWVSWPKRSSKVPTDIDEQRIRDLALPLGLVDIKVCAIDNTWSGLKLMIRKELRKDVRR